MKLRNNKITKTQPKSHIYQYQKLNKLKKKDIEVAKILIKMSREIKLLAL